MFGLVKSQEPLLFCPKCGGQYGHIINFGMSGHCWGCRNVWDLDNKKTIIQRNLAYV